MPCKMLSGIFPTLISRVDVQRLIDERRLSPNVTLKGALAETAESARTEEAKTDREMSVIQEELWISIVNLRILLRA